MWRKHYQYSQTPCALYCVASLTIKLELVEHIPRALPEHAVTMCIALCMSAVKVKTKMKMNTKMEIKLKIKIKMKSNKVLLQLASSPDILYEST